jgi:hypothetical protein
VLTDVTGFYENIDLEILFSDLRALGCDPEILQLLRTAYTDGVWCPAVEFHRDNRLPTFSLRFT